MPQKKDPLEQLFDDVDDLSARVKALEDSSATMAKTRSLWRRPRNGENSPVPASCDWGRCNNMTYTERRAKYTTATGGFGWHWIPCCGDCLSKEQ